MWTRIASVTISVTYSDLRKMRSHYPNWTLARSLKQIFEEIVDGWRARVAA